MEEKAGMPSAAQPTPTDEVVLALYLEIGENERHFNKIEAQYRFLASTWLLAMLGAVGYLLAVAKGVDLAMDRDFIVSAVGMLGAIGLTLVWTLDLRVYHQLLDTHFIEGLALELKYKWLPRTRLKMFPRLLSKDESHSHIRVLPKIRFFYVISISVCLLIFSLFAIRFVDQAYPTFGIVLDLMVVLGLLLLSASWILWIWRGSKSPMLRTWIEASYQSGKF